MQQTKHTCLSGQLCHWHAPDAQFAEINGPPLNENRRKPEPGKRKGLKVPLSNELFTCTLPDCKSPEDGSSCSKARAHLDPGHKLPGQQQVRSPTHASHFTHRKRLIGKRDALEPRQQKQTCRDENDPALCQSWSGESSRSEQSSAAWNSIILQVCLCFGFSKSQALGKT